MTILRERSRGSNKSRSVTLLQALVTTSLLLVGHTTCAIPLLDGRYATQTDVQDILDLALDAAQMKEAETFQAKEQIYVSVRTMLHRLRCSVHIILVFILSLFVIVFQHITGTKSTR